MSATRKRRKPAPATDARPWQIARIPLERVVVGHRQRALDPLCVEAIQATLPAFGMRNPIEVAAIGDGYRLIDGRRRLEAARAAGWTTIDVQICRLDDADIEASASFREAFGNLLQPDLLALDRMAHLAAAKTAHDRLYPDASKAGRPRKVTRAAENNLPVFGKFAFSRDVAERVGLSRSLVNMLTTAWAALSVASRARLPGSKLADRQGELLALADLPQVTQRLVLDQLLAAKPKATSVAEALAQIEGRTLPDADERRVLRYAATLGIMPVDQLDRVLVANEEAIRAFAQRRGWLA